MSKEIEIVIGLINLTENDLIEWMYTYDIECGNIYETLKEEDDFTEHRVAFYKDKPSITINNVTLTIDEGELYNTLYEAIGDMYERQSLKDYNEAIEVGLSW